MLETDTQEHTGKINLKSQSQAATITKFELVQCLANYTD